MDIELENNPYFLPTVVNPGTELGRIKPGGMGYVITSIEAPPLLIIFFVLLLLGMGFGLIRLSLAAVNPEQDSSLMWMPIIFGSLLIFFRLLLLWGWIQVAKYRPARLHLSQHQYRLGEKLKVAFVYPRRFGALGRKSEIVGRLACLHVQRTRATDPDSGKDYFHSQEVLHEIPLPTQTLSPSAHAFEADWNIELPKDAPATQIGENEWTVWQLQINAVRGGKVLSRVGFVIDII